MVNIARYKMLTVKAQSSHIETFTNTLGPLLIGILTVKIDYIFIA